MGCTSPALIGCALLAVILLTLFVRTEQRAGPPLVDLALFRRSAFSIGNAAGFMSYAALFGVFFLMPSFRARLPGFGPRGRTAAVDRSGDARCDRAARRLALRPARRPHRDRIGHADLHAVLVLLYGTADGTPSSLPLVMLALAAFGLGQGLFTPPNNSAIMAAAPTIRPARPEPVERDAFFRHRLRRRDRIVAALMALEVLTGARRTRSTSPGWTCYRQAAT